MGKMHGTLAKAGKVSLLNSGQKTNTQSWKARKNQKNPQRKMFEKIEIQ